MIVHEHLNGIKCHFEGKKHFAQIYGYYNRTWNTTNLDLNQNLPNKTKRQQLVEV